MRFASVSIKSGRKMPSPYTMVYLNEHFEDYPVTVMLADPFKMFFDFSVEDAEALAQQILNACQDYRETQKEKKNGE